MSISEVSFRDPTAGVLAYIASNLRASDREEVRLSHGHDPYQAVECSVSASDFAKVVSVNGTPCVVLGLVIHDILSGVGSPWLLGADLVMRHQRELLRQTGPVIAEMLSICPNLYNYVYEGNVSSIRWLRWLGFTLHAPEPFGVKGALFHKFTMRKSSDV